MLLILPTWWDVALQYLDNSGSFNNYDDVIDTWPFNIQDDDLDHNYNYNDKAQMDRRSTFN